MDGRESTLVVHIQMMIVRVSSAPDHIAPLACTHAVLAHNGVGKKGLVTFSDLGVTEACDGRDGDGGPGIAGRRFDTKRGKTALTVKEVQLSLSSRPSQLHTRYRRLARPHPFAF